MLEAIPTADVNVLAFSANGMVSGDNYETVLIPALEGTLTENDKTRLLYHLGPKFDGIEGNAMRDDAKVSMRHLTDSEQIAVVTDDNSMIRMEIILGFLMLCEERVFGNDDFDATMAWTVE